MSKHRRGEQVNVRLSSSEKARLAEEARRRGLSSVGALIRQAALAMTRTYTYRVHIEPAEEGGFVVTVPALGCATQGETFDEAIDMAQDCIQGYLQMLADLGKPIPVEKVPKKAVNTVVRVKATIAA